MSPDDGSRGQGGSAYVQGLDEFLEERDATRAETDPGEADASAPATPNTVRKWIILGLLAAGLLHTLGASLWMSVPQVPISDQLGLFQLLPIPYWLGLGLLGLATVLAMREGSDIFIVLTGAALLAIIAGTPNLFETNPSNWDAYSHFSEAQLILSTDHLPAVNGGQYSANWPGLFLLIAMLDAASAAPALAIVTLHPFLAGALTFLALFTFLREVFPKPVAAPASVLSSLFAVWAQYHLSPQSIGLVLALLILAFVWRRGIRWRAACSLLFLGLVVSHPTMTVVLLGILAVMSLLSPLWARKVAGAVTEGSPLRRLTAVYIGIWSAWLYFHATATYAVASTAVLGRIGQLISLPEATVNVAAARTAGNLLPLAPILRLGSLAVFGVLGLMGLLILLRRPEHQRLGWFLLSALVAIGVLGGADLVGLGGEFYDRSLLIFAVLAPGMCLAGWSAIRLPRPVRHAAVVLLVVATVTAASTAYYLEAFNQVSDRSVAATDFLQNVPSGSAVLDGMYPQPIWEDPANWTPFTSARFFTIYPASPQIYAGSAPTYLVFDNTSKLWYEQWLGSSVYQSYEQNQTDFSRIYDNGQAAVYFVGP